MVAALMRNREDKIQYILKLMKHRDFLGITETHGTAGEVENISWPGDMEGFWSPGSTSQAGVGIVVKKEFLARFCFSVPVFDPVIPGRLGVLRLSGEQGDLDIWVAYFPTGTREKRAEGEAGPKKGEYKTLAQMRSEIRETLARHLAPREKRLSLICGDFNTTVCKEDRWRRGEKSRQDRDANEELEWSSRVAKPFGLYEIKQEDATYQAFENNILVCRSRIDRFYSNQPISDQLDKEIQCAALEWPPTSVSSHRALVASRCTKESKRQEDRPIPDWVCKSKDFAMRVSVGFRSRVGDLYNNNKKVGPLRELIILKQCMKEVSSSIQKALKLKNPILTR